MRGPAQCNDRSRARSGRVHNPGTENAHYYLIPRIDPCRIVLIAKSTRDAQLIKVLFNIHVRHAASIRTTNSYVAHSVDSRETTSAKKKKLFFARIFSSDISCVQKLKTTEKKKMCDRENRTRTTWMRPKFSGEQRTKARSRWYSLNWFL